MALIKCENCGKNISDKAKKCVHCGIKIKKYNKVDRKKQMKENIIIYGILLITILILSIISLYQTNIYSFEASEIAERVCEYEKINNELIDLIEVRMSEEHITLKGDDGNLTYSNYVYFKTSINNELYIVKYFDTINNEKISLENNIKSKEINEEWNKAFSVNIEKTKKYLIEARENNCDLFNKYADYGNVEYIFLGMPFMFIGSLLVLVFISINKIMHRSKLNTIINAIIILIFSFFGSVYFSYNFNNTILQLVYLSLAIIIIINYIRKCLNIKNN